MHIVIKTHYYNAYHMHGRAHQFSQHRIPKVYNAAALLNKY